MCDFKPEVVKNCKYYLPCGMCDKTGKECNCTQWSFSIIPPDVPSYPSYYPYYPSYTDSVKKIKGNRTILNEDNEERNL